MNPLSPTVEQWYRHLDKGEMFRVVATDPDEGWVEIQNFSGEIEQLEEEEWRALKVETCDAPEDWSGPYDDLELDDLGDTERDRMARDWRAPLNGANSGPEAWDDLVSQSPGNGWDE